MLKIKKHETKHMTPAELSVFFSELSMLFESGISLSQAMYIMSENAADKNAGQLYSQICSMLDEGASLSDALRQSGRFPGHASDITRIGETSGKLETVLTGLSSYYDRQDSLQKSIRNVLTYPLIMVAVMLCVLSVLIIKVLPLFGSVFKTTGAKMPFILKLVTENTLAPYLLIALLLLILFLLTAFFISGGKALSSGNEENGIISKLPFMMKLSEKAATGNFTYSMALLLSGGISVEAALDMTLEMTSNQTIKSKLEIIQNQMTSGSSFSEAVIKSEILEPAFSLLLSAGEKSGRIDSVMDMIADKYTENIQNRINSVLSVIEPTLVIIMSLVIGGVLLSIMVPLMNIMTTI